MLHTNIFRHRTTRAIAGAVAGLLLVTGTVAASPASLRDMGKANVQGGGYWGIEVITEDDVIAGGYTYARVTNGSCETTSPTALVFETYLTANESGDGSFSGELSPVSPAAKVVALQPNFEGQAATEPVGGGTHVSAYLEGMPGGRDLRLCLGGAGN